MRAHRNPFLVSGLSLFVIGDDGFEKIPEALVSAGVVFARYLQQQFLERIETAQRVPRDGIRQARAQHHKLLLAFIFRCSHGPTHRVIQTAQLALGTGIHVAHAADHAVRLIIQVQRIGDQLLDIDLGRALEPAPVTTAVATPIAPATFAAPIAMRTTTAFAATTTGSASAFSPWFLTTWFLLRRFRHPNLVFLCFGLLHAWACYIIPSVDNLAHSSATRPEGRNFKFTGFFPTRSAIRLVRAF